MHAVVWAVILSVQPETIGIAVSPGAFRMAGAVMTGTGSIREGASIETDAMPSKLVLRSGAKVEMAAHSRTRLYSDRVVLEAGRSRVSGPIRVTNDRGLLLAQVMPGRALDFTLSAMSTASVRISGILESREDAYWMTDELTRIEFRLSAEEEVLDKMASSVGKGVQIEGVIAQNVIQVTNLALTPVIAAAAAGAAAAAASTATTATAGTAAAAAAGASHAVIAGVSIAAAGAGATAGIVRATSSGSTISQ